MDKTAKMELNPLPSNEGWMIGMTEDSRADALGLTARKHGRPLKEAIRIYWHRRGDGAEMAARLRELANALEGGE